MRNALRGVEKSKSGKSRTIGRRGDHSVSTHTARTRNLVEFSGLTVYLFISFKPKPR